MRDGDLFFSVAEAVLSMQCVRRLVHITTVPVSLWSFLTGQIDYMRAAGFDVQAISSPGDYLTRFANREQVVVHAVQMPRRITPFRDAVSVFRLVRLLRRIRPDIVHAGTPKGGLLGVVAATLARVPVRVYQMHGLPMMTASGHRRWLLRWSERVSCGLAHRVVCVSHSIREVAIAEALCPAEKITVLLGGSCNGVDATERFDPSRFSSSTRSDVRDAYGIPGTALVVGFVGRIVRDKGVVELAEAWQGVREMIPEVRLLMVGPSEVQDALPPHVEHLLRTDPRVHIVGHVDDVPALYAAMDLVVLPTYREGFPNVPLEAAAMGLPVVATRVPGCTDAVQDDITGRLVPPRDSTALADAIMTYLRDPALRRAHGEAGRKRVLREFRQEAIWEALHQEYIHLLQERGLPLPRANGEPAAVSATGEVD